MSSSNSKGRGVLPVSVAATRKVNKQAPRAPAPRLRLIVRRLPPGLTETEFWDALGTEWRVGQGKVDWAAYKAGKISKDLAKPSKPSRAYLKVKDSAHLDSLSQRVRAVSFQDAKNSLRDPCLIGPPSLEFAPYNKSPGGRVRHDGRQGTIDQDAEFIDFLQSLTEPITKASANGESAEEKAEKVLITPLVQYIKEKKANKAKEKEAAAAAKATKKGQDSKEIKDSKEKTAVPSKTEQRPAVVKKSATSEAEKARIAKATQDAVTAINKSVAAMKGKTVPEKSEATTTKASKEPTPSPQTTPKRERQRGDASAAARIIGRDLGLTPKEGRTPRGSRAASTPIVSTTTAPAPTPPPVPAAATGRKAVTPIPAAAPAPQTPTPISTPIQPPTGPRNLRNATPHQAPSKSNPMPSAPKAVGKPPQHTPGAKSAFLKHANPSQGVTEDLLRTVFSNYGTITRCEIDKKKGLGYIDFMESEGLGKALAASPVKVGNGSVVVLENRTPYRKVSQAPPRPGSASPITSVASSPRVTNATLASISEQLIPQLPVNTQNATAPATVSTPTTPSTTQLPNQKTSPNADAQTPTANTVPPLPSNDPTVPTTDQVVLPSAPRGSVRGGARGNPRGGRGYRGRGGNHRGGNRAASANVAASSATASQSAGNQAGAGATNTTNVPPSTSGNA